jgi:predicted aldo/keto reductase-like oxidoreductase
MERYRSQFFLATKTGERTYQQARDEIHRSLERLRVDQIDLIQLHNLVDEAEWERAMDTGGALEAAVEARDQGLVRFIGVTGHGTQTPVMHRRSLERFPFDSVLLPYNYTMMQNPQYVADFEALLALCQERDVAVQTIKAVARRPWPTEKHTYAPWYEPLDDQASIDRAMHWVLSRPGIFVNTLGDIHLLPKVLDAASRFQNAPSDAEMQADMTKLNMEPLFV